MLLRELPQIRAQCRFRIGGAWKRCRAATGTEDLHGLFGVIQTQAGDLDMLATSSSLAGRGIRVNTLSLGAIDMPMMAVATRAPDQAAASFATSG